MRRLTILGILACVVLLVVPAFVQAASPPPIIQGNVTVVNPPSQPVPVTGSVTATVPGQVAVTVPAGVTVTNPQDGPVPTYQTLPPPEPPLYPVNVTYAAIPSTTPAQLYTVPDHFRLIIDYVSYWVEWDPRSSTPMWAVFNLHQCSSCPNPIMQYLPLGQIVQFDVGTAYSSYGQQMHVIVEPGWIVEFEFGSAATQAGGGGKFGGTASLSGRLVPIL